MQTLIIMILSCLKTLSTIISAIFFWQSYKVKTPSEEELGEIVAKAPFIKLFKALNQSGKYNRLGGLFLAIALVIEIILLIFQLGEKL